MRRMLVIGAKGMLGRDLIQALRRSFGAPNRPEWDLIGWDLEEIDIRHEGSTISKIESLEPEIVINAAAYTDVDGCESRGDEVYSVNAEGMKHVAMGAKRCGSRVVYLSTDYVFDGRKGEPYSEEDPPNPLSVYGMSKWKGEQYLQALIQESLIVRTQWLYGRHGKNFVASVLRQAREKKILSIVDDQTGSPTYTVDLSGAIVSLVQSKSSGIFHVANRGFCTWHAFGQSILKFSGIEGVTVQPISSKALGRPATRPSFSVLDTGKFEQKTGLGLRPWEEALKDYLMTGC